MEGKGAAAGRAPPRRNDDPVQVKPLLCLRPSVRPKNQTFAESTKLPPPTTMDPPPPPPLSRLPFFPSPHSVPPRSDQAAASQAATAPATAAEPRG
ncbi:hypothetical protein ZWY2020_032092 [Hordeum vulgare]|nr:hypothetical protein ZWY2020_032092 [Hordeum vulgare]